MARRRRFRILLATASGAVLSYFFDPQQGGTRRSRTAQQVRTQVQRRQRQVEQEAQEEEQRAQSLAYQSPPGGALPPQPSPPQGESLNNPDLVDRVRSQAFKGPRWHPYTINVDAADGVVTIRGVLDDPAQIVEAEHAVRAIAGVDDVVNLLHVRGTPAPNKAEAERASEQAEHADDAPLGTTPD